MLLSRKKKLMKTDHVVLALYVIVLDSHHPKYWEHMRCVKLLRSIQLHHGDYFERKMDCVLVGSMNRTCI